MCDATVVAVAVAVIGAGLSAYQQQSQANQEKEYQKEVQKARQAEAIDAYAQLKIREFQQREQAAADIARLTAQARAAAGSAKLQAVESGTAGGSVEALLADFARQELTGVRSVRTNLAASVAQIQKSQKAALKVDKPSLLLGPLDTNAGRITTGLGVVAAGTNAYLGSRPAGV